MYGGVVGGTDWGEGAKDKCGAMERAILRRKWLGSVDRDQEYDRR